MKEESKGFSENPVLVQKIDPPKEGNTRIPAIQTIQNSLEYAKNTVSELDAYQKIVEKLTELAVFLIGFKKN